MPVGGFLAGLFCFEVDNLCAVGEKVDAIKHPRDQLVTKHHIERAFPPKFHVRIRFGQALGHGLVNQALLHFIDSFGWHLFPE